MSAATAAELAASRPQLRFHASHAVDVLAVLVPLIAAPLVGVGAAPARVLGGEHDKEVAAIVVLLSDPPEG